MDLTASFLAIVAELIHIECSFSFEYIIDGSFDSVSFYGQCFCFALLAPQSFLILHSLWQVKL
jgi:hypothetical protein